MTAGLEPGPAHPRVRVQHVARRQGDRRPAPPLRRRGSRARNLANEASDASVQALVDAVRGPLRHPATLVHAQGPAARDRPARRLRPDGVGRHRPSAEFGWDEGHRDRARRVRLVLAARWPTSCGGSSTNGGSTHRCGPAKRRRCVLRVHRAVAPPVPVAELDTARRRDVLTLAHELGHGVHAYLAREQGVFHQTTPLTLAETASVFGETVTFGRLLDATDRSRRTARAPRRESRGPDRDGVPPDRDEPLRGRRAHRAGARRASCPSSASASCGRRRRTAMLGDSVEITDGYRTWWSLHPALHRHARVRVRLRVRSAARAVGVPRYERGGAPTSCPRYLELLARRWLDAARGARAGSSASISPTPAFWDGGLDIVAEQLDAAEAAAAATGRV